MLIAAEKGARLIVSVGSQFNLVEFLDRNRKGMSSTFLTRLRIGEILVDAKGVSRLYRPRPGSGPLLFVLAAGGLTIAAIIVTQPGHHYMAALPSRKTRELHPPVPEASPRPPRARPPLPVHRHLPRRASAPCQYTC